MKRSFVFYLGIGLTFLFLSASCLHAEKKKAAKKLYVNNFYGFSLECPKGWKIVENYSSGGMHAIVAFGGPKINGFTVSVIVTVENAQGQTLEGYVSVAKQNQQQYFTSYSLVKEGRLNIGSKNAYFIQISHDTTGILTQQKIVLFKKGSNVFSVGFTALPESFDKYLVDFDKSVSTFKFLK